MENPLGESKPTVIGLEDERHTTALQILMNLKERLQYFIKMEKNVYVFGGKTAKFKATKRYVHFENFPSIIHWSDSRFFYPYIYTLSTSLLRANFLTSRMRRKYQTQWRL